MKPIGWTALVFTAALVAFGSARHAEIAAAMQAAFQANGLACRTFVLPVDRQGVQVSVMEA